MTQRQLLGAIDQFVPESIRGNPKQYYAYEAVFFGVTLLGASATVAVTTSVDNDSDFLVLGINRVVADGPTQLIQKAFPPIVMQLVYTGAGSSFFQQPEHIENVAGTAQAPGILAFPFMVPGGATLVTTLTNLDTALTYAVRISYFGCKFFRGR